MRYESDDYHMLLIPLISESSLLTFDQTCWANQPLDSDSHELANCSINLARLRTQPPSKETIRLGHNRR